MRKHETTFQETVKAKCTLNGMTVEQLSAKTGISRATFTRKLADGRWTRDQLQQMHRFLNFTPEDLQIFLEGK